MAYPKWMFHPDGRKKLLAGPADEEPGWFDLITDARNYRAKPAVEEKPVAPSPVALDLQPAVESLPMEAADLRKCKRCGKTGHNIRSCTARI